LKFEPKSGKDKNCKISITPIQLPQFPNDKLNLVICRGFGEEPLMLITNYVISDGLAEIFSKPYVGIQSFFRRRPKSKFGQLQLFSWD